MSENEEWEDNPASKIWKLSLQPLWMNRMLISVRSCGPQFDYFERKRAPAQPRTHICISTRTHKKRTQLGAQIGDNTSSNYHHSFLSLVCGAVYFSLRWNDWKETNVWETEKPSELRETRKQRRSSFRCNTRYLPPKWCPRWRWTTYELINDWRCHWWEKNPSHPNLLSAYGSTAKLRRSTTAVTALQSDSRDPAAL